MPELRKDPVTGNWVVLSPERKMRPQFYSGSGANELTPENCPFCAGNESMTPPEIDAVRDKNSRADQRGWHLRVVPNKFPALRVEGEPGKRAEGFYDKMNGIGAHEVIIETDSHTKGMDELGEEEVTDVFLTFKRRILDLKQDIRLKYIQVFKNHGRMAGATISHPHSQVVALPMVPLRLREMLNRAEVHFSNKERCLFCDIVQHEEEYGKRVLLESGNYIVLSPFAPKFPFEMVFYPKVHAAAFEETGDAKLRELACVFRETLSRINRALESPDYNLVLHNVPFRSNDGCESYFHWHLELVPVLSGTGGFELGTFSYINPTSPEEAIAVLNSTK
ncbi:MAG: galactose-1-phosphate uridylyltransferase [bacterium]|nr:galactose-1-phosphate uridylyltransferase [bacterium]